MDATTPRIVRERAGRWAAICGDERLTLSRDPDGSWIVRRGGYPLDGFPEYRTFGEAKIGAIAWLQEYA
jgi:hypothetical protein